MDARPIGVFDSGVGGLTVVSQMRRMLPGESIVYFGDLARLPYGSKSKQSIIQFSHQIMHFLLGQDVKAVIIACGTASSNSLEEMRSCYSLPIMGVVEPGAHAAANKTRNKRIGVIGTEATVSSGAYSQLLAGLDPEIQVFSRACPLFVPLVEEGWFDDAAFGHIHKVAQLIPGKVVMAGSLEPTDCNDFGPHGFWMGELTERGTSVFFYPIKKCEYIQQEINVTPELSAYAVSELVRQELQSRKPYQISHVILRGYRDAETELPLDEIAEMERVVRVVDETEPDYQFDLLKQKYDGTLLQKYIEVMEQCPNLELRKKALYYGVQAMLDTAEEGRERIG